MNTVMPIYPCRNPACRSVGKPHPNCRCGPVGHSDGGEVGHFCSKENKHNLDCEYYMNEGGLAGQEVPAEDLPQDEIAKKESVPSEVVEQPAPPELSGKEVPPDDIPNHTAPGQEVPKEDLPEEPATGLEGIKQKGLAYLEGVPGVGLLEAKTGLSTPENIKKRKEAYPAQHALGSFQSSAAVAIATEGASVLTTLLATTGYAGVDEIGKSLLDNPNGDIKKAVGMAVLRGFLDTTMFKLTDGLFSHVGESQLVQSQKWAKAAEDAMINLAEKPIQKGAAAVVSKLGVNPVVRTVSKALGAASKIPEILSGDLSGLLGEVGEAGIEYNLTRRALDPILEKVLGKRLTKANDIVGDAILNQLIKKDFFGVPAAIRYAQSIAGNRNTLTPIIKSIMKQGQYEFDDKLSNGIVNEIKEWVSNGGVDKELQDSLPNGSNQSNYAEGGEIAAPKQDHFAVAYPVHNMMLNQVKGRVYGYLNSIRPQEFESKLPFDSKTPQTQKHKDYDNAVKIAASPMSVLSKINKGNLTPKDMTHLTQMYPEAYYAMSQEITKEISHAQLSGEKPPYKKRQMMSLFLGVNLDSTFTPQALSTIQGMYAIKGRNGQPQAQKPKKSTSPLSKLAPSAMTDSQARTTREQNQKA